ncbi:IS5 family transposase IS4811 [Streptomyces sp. RB5]|uniref:IS5 family transposase IS4811 n=1 Tax=Streptomyces smaragdinus TaxID=2585196 RepID=A0A7K0CNM0_9ACTN|nr:AraC family transcriptional regulator [Streptomyces smaragdinus]MQY15011.1 IS5 family transposase IS4811 [Streptomyces smaragdinus]
MAIDRLSQVFDLIQVRGVLTGGVAARGGWWSRGPLADPVKFFAMVSGSARLSTNGVDHPITLEPGDVAILTGRSHIALESGAEPRHEVRPESDFSAPPFLGADHTDDVLIGGCIDINEAGRAVLLDALPPLAHVRASDAEPLRADLERLFTEASTDRLGSAFAVRQYGQLLLLDVLRAYIAQTDLPPGWLRLLTDDRLRPAVDLIRADPGHPWTLPELATATAMSRTTFAERFRETAGMPPLTFLGHWRMLLAQRALRDADTRVATLATTLGYGSESAFSTAFKRVVGEAPRRYRSRVREEAVQAG